MIKDLPNLSSIFYYTYPEFRNFIFGLEDNSIPVYDVIKKNFREWTNIKKEYIVGKIGDLKNNQKNIRDLFTKLRESLAPKSKVDTPFETTKNVRGKALQKRLEQLGFIVSSIARELLIDN